MNWKGFLLFTLSMNIALAAHIESPVEASDETDVSVLIQEEVSGVINDSGADKGVIVKPDGGRDYFDEPDYYSDNPEPDGDYYSEDPEYYPENTEEPDYYDEYFDDYYYDE